MAFDAFRLRPPFKKISELPHVLITLSGDLIPTFVEFKELTDPSSATIVPLDGVELALGSDTSFVSAAVELNRRPNHVWDCWSVAQGKDTEGGENTVQ